MRSKKISIIFLLICIFFFTANFKQDRFDRKKNLDLQLRRLNFQLMKKNHPFRLKVYQYAKDQILVKFKSTLSEPFIEATIAYYQSKRIKRIPKLNIYQLQIPEDITVEEMVYSMNQNPDVEYAEPNYIFHITVTPNDTLFTHQYALHNSGQEIGIPGSPQGKERADIKAPEAWEETKGDEDVIIAVIDTGVDLSHPDIKNKVESTGRDFVNDDFDATDDHGHGTHVAGIAAAETNNNEGVAGVAWNAKILAVKAMDAEGGGFYSEVIDAIRWAADNGADVINISLGGDAASQALEQALSYAYQKDIVIVAAAGNDEEAVLYPAAYDEYCLAVAATDYNDIRPSWSNFGPEIDVAAPGERILSCVPTWYFGPGSLPYGYGYGTSMATPHVAGLAALIKSIKPWLTATEIMNMIRYSADDINATEYPGKDEFVGYGRLNMEKALVPIIISKSK